MDPTNFAEFVLSRWERAQRLMNDKGIDLLFITDDHNYFYFTGHRMTADWQTHARPLFFLLPRQGDPVTMLHEFKVGDALKTSPVKDIRPYHRLDTSPIDEVLELISEIGGRNIRIGAELGKEQRLGVPYAHFEELKSRLENCVFVDAADILWTLRMTKDQFEIDQIRKACEVQSRGYERMFEKLRPGMTEWEAARHLSASIFEEGGDGIGFLIVVSGRGNYTRISGWPTNRKIQKGEMVWFDCGTIVNGYNSDYSRAAVLGKPNDCQKKMQEIVHELTMRSIDVIKPNIDIGEIVNACNIEAKKLNTSTSFHAGRLGHGVGLMTTEPPHVALYDHTILEPGMVITVEPGIVTEDGTFHIEENVLVTETGFELLSLCDWQLRSL